MVTFLSAHKISLPYVLEVPTGKPRWPPGPSTPCPSRKLHPSKLDELVIILPAVLLLGQEEKTHPGQPATVGDIGFTGPGTPSPPFLRQKPLGLGHHGHRV